MLLHDVDDDVARWTNAVVTLVSSHPGAARPVSDQFAVSLVPIAIVLHRQNPQAAADYLKAVARWLLDRSDPSQAGLGLGSMYEPPREVVERLLGGWLESTNVSRSQSSYVLTVILDLCLSTQQSDLFSAVRTDADALRLTPYTTSVGKRPDTFRREGGPVRPVPRIAYDTDGSVTPPRKRDSGWSPRDTLLLTASCRSRHYTDSITALLNHSADGD